MQKVTIATAIATALRNCVIITALETLFKVMMLFDATAANAMSACLQPEVHNSYRCS